MFFLQVERDINITHLGSSFKKKIGMRRDTKEEKRSKQNKKKACYCLTDLMRQNI